MNKVIIESRKAQLKAMHEVMCNTNDEGLYMRWISLGVPDCPTEDDFEFIAGKRGERQHSCHSTDHEFLGQFHFFLLIFILFFQYFSQRGLRVHNALFR